MYLFLKENGKGNLQFVYTIREFITFGRKNIFDKSQGYTILQHEGYYYRNVGLVLLAPDDRYQRGKRNWLVSFGINFDLGIKYYETSHTSLWHS